MDEGVCVYSIAKISRDSTRPRLAADRVYNSGNTVESSGEKVFDGVGKDRYLKNSRSTTSFARLNAYLRSRFIS